MEETKGKREGEYYLHLGEFDETALEKALFCDVQVQILALPLRHSFNPEPLHETYRYLPTTDRTFFFSSREQIYTLNRGEKRTARGVFITRNGKSTSTTQPEQVRKGNFPTILRSSFDWIIYDPSVRAGANDLNAQIL